MRVQIPDLSLVVLVGPSGSGKSTFARRHFLPSETLNSDACRAWVSDDENDQSVTREAFEILHFIAAKRLAAGRLVVADATNVQADSRKPFIDLARQQHCVPVAVVFNLDERVCQDRNRARTDRGFGPHVIRQQRSQLRRSLRGLRREGFRYVYVFETAEEVDAAVVERVPLWTDRRGERGPFDIIGDVHGCCTELEQLLARLGYQQTAIDSDPVWGALSYRHPQGRRAVFLGDVVDRGPRVLDSLRLVRNMVAHGDALCVPGNHDVKLLKKLSGRDVRVSHGLAETLAEIDSLPDAIREPFRQQAAEFLDKLISHYVLDGGKLVVAHAGMKQEMQGRASGRVREFALYGATTGETDEFGLPTRYDWAAEYRGQSTVVYGHTPVPAPAWLNRTVNIDTGCVFGGQLTALRYPELDFVAVEALATYCEPTRPFLHSSNGDARSDQQIHDDLLDADDVVGKRIISTRLRANVTIREENATAALELMSRFAANPKWLIYLPPTMSPSETSNLEGYLEHPAEAFAYFRRQGVAQVVCEEKHMGSRAVVIVCRDADAARARFGVLENEAGIVYTRTGRRFFDDASVEAAILDRLRQSLTASDYWRQFDSSWFCFDCELLPWSAKAQELLKNQYAAVGAAGRGALPAAIAAIDQARARLAAEEAPRADALAQEFRSRAARVARFVDSYRRYCWPVDSIDDYRLAPFHLLASENAAHADKPHAWHMETLRPLCDASSNVLLATPWRIVDLLDDGSVAVATDWWLALTAAGGEGMVVKPADFIAQGKDGLVQPAVKCRGREYLRIIYGPDYDTERNLARLRRRGLAAKRSLALREFALGIEALERFVRREPLRRVHECVFGVLALESEPVDPRL